ncbi:MAG: glycosyltransferase family 2 protein [Pseudomonadota bacterium]
MSISVIIPFYNETIFLSQAVHSALGLGNRLHQIIIVDDSPGRHADLMERMSGVDPRIEIVTNPRNMGASASRNSGLTRVTGEQVLFLDSDDVIASRAVLEASDFIRELGAELVHIPTMAMAHQTSAMFRFPRDDRLFAKPAARLSVETCPEIRFAIASWSFLFNAQYLSDHAIGFDPEQRMFEDHLFILGAVENARNFALLGQWGHVWRKRGGSLTTTDYSRADIDLQLASIRKSLLFLSERYGPDSAVVQRDVAFALMRFLTNWPTLFAALEEPEADASAAILADIAQTFAPYTLSGDVCSAPMTLRVLGRDLWLLSGVEFDASWLSSIFDMVVQADWARLRPTLHIEPGTKKRGVLKPAAKVTLKDALDRFHTTAQDEASVDLRLFSEVVFDEIDEWCSAPCAVSANGTPPPDVMARFSDDLAATLSKRSLNRSVEEATTPLSGRVPRSEPFQQALALTRRYLNGKRSDRDGDALNKPAIAAAWRAAEDSLSPERCVRAEAALSNLANCSIKGDANIWGRRKVRTKARLLLRPFVPGLRP